MGNHKKADQLGEPYGTACHKLRKSVLFSILTRFNLNVCHRCGDLIDNIATLSLEHKTPWLDTVDPRAAFYDLDNVAFSHMHCNIAAARKPNQYPTVEARDEARRLSQRVSKQRAYTPDKRHAKYVATGQ